MTGTLTTQVRFFTPASATTTGWQGAADEMMSSAGIDTYTGYVDIAASDEAIAQALGENFVPGANYSPAGDLVARAKEFAQELPQAGLLLARAGLLAADGATGAGAGASIAIAAARSAILAGGGLFAAGDPDEESGQLHDTATVQPRQTPAERLAALRADIKRLVAEGGMLERDGWKGEAQTKFNDAAQVYQEIISTNGLLTESEFEPAFEAAAILFGRGGDQKMAQEMRDSLRLWREAKRQSPTAANLDDAAAAAGAAKVRSEEPRITPPHILKPIETARQMGLIRPESPLFELVRGRAYELVFAYVELAVSDWFDLSFKERLEIGGGGNSEQVPEDWFVRHFTGLFEDRGAVAPSAQGEITREEVTIGIWTSKFIGLIQTGSIHCSLADAPEALEKAVRKIVSDWFALPTSKRMDISVRLGGNPDTITLAWFKEQIDAVNDN